MVKIYKCIYCNYSTNQKSHYINHINKKIPCKLNNNSMDDYINKKTNEKLNIIINKLNIILQKNNINIDIKTLLNTTLLFD
jgi:hypothetical protein